MTGGRGTRLRGRSARLSRLSRRGLGRCLGERRRRPNCTGAQKREREPGAPNSTSRQEPRRGRALRASGLGPSNHSSQS
ncbi:hypothetical protein AKJ09_10105 [Labilithrix luteola]|uniref:Uncharacterized protein n=1 Tax=Labilithrix luteola TaxID=1391654 RepID=A0A0K1QCQ3_9BACT|nr:hypothetical protein AKJ09_10105 [Labilithrix luteola]